MKHLPAHLTVALILTLISACVHAQPMPEEVDPTDPNRSFSVRCGDYYEPLLRVWKAPGPFSMEWIIAYNETPLTFDRPNFQISLKIGSMPLHVLRSDQVASFPGKFRVINTGQGKPAYAQADETQVGNTVEYELTKPDGTTVTSGVLLEMCHLPGSRPVIFFSGESLSGSMFRSGETVLHIDSEIHRLFGELEPGEHTLVVHMDSGQRLATGTKREVISEWFRVSTPKLRFTVIEREIPEPEPGVVHGCFTPHLNKNGLYTLTNPLDKPISIMAVESWVTQRPPNASRVRQPYKVRGTRDCLTHLGWVGKDLEMPSSGKVCRITIAPGHTVELAMVHKPHKNYLSRLRLMAFLDDDTPVTFVTGAIQNEE